MKKMKLLILTLVTLMSVSTFAQNMSDWCEDRMMTLRDAKSDAEMAYQAGDYLGALSTLELGFRQASHEIRGFYTGALTAKAILRGVSLSAEVKKHISNKQLFAKTMIHFMLSYVDFIDSVANELDAPWYSVSNCYYCRGQGHMDFEQKYVEFAEQQVSVILQTMVTVNGYRVYPLGEPAAYLKSLQLSLGFMAQDLNTSLFAASYACVTRKANVIAAKLASYNSGRGGYPNDVYAVNTSYQQVAELLQSSGPCAGAGTYSSSSSNSGVTTEDLISTSFYVRDGQSQTVDLGGMRYIKKLIISAEGQWRDATFDVVVNGDIKGTIHVPGRDPAYFVNIEARASSVQLVSRGGTAIVHQIQIVQR